jgi:hypothetical protein
MSEQIRSRRVVVGFSGGVTSAWCAGWALRTFPREEVVLLWHDTKEEDPDTYRFLREMAAALEMPITERSDGRSVTQLFEDEEFLGNNQNSMCSRILKTEQGEAYVQELRAQGFEVIRVVGFSAMEPKRIARWAGFSLRGGYTVRFPIIEERVTKQQCADWCQCEMGVKPSSVYEDFEHANCMNCVKGGLAYQIAAMRRWPVMHAVRSEQERRFGHTILRGGDRAHPFLDELVNIRLKRTVNQRESITLGACECGD